jgi:adenylosuccinate lyase
MGQIPMLAKTHGQPASPTRLGKEIMVFAYRLEQQLSLLKATPISAKFGGATGISMPTMLPILRSTGEHSASFC